jgi:phospholipid/cholesterol/gamma-HCH transport system substrate-binding protein
MKRFNTEVVVGLFLTLGLITFAFLAVRLGGLGDTGVGRYVLEARFQSTSGLKQGADVEMAGVIIGKVLDIRFDRENYEAVVDLSIPDGVELQEDAIASVRSTGLIGGKFVKLTAGGSERILKPGELIVQTESSVNIEELISKYIFETGDK